MNNKNFDPFADNNDDSFCDASGDENECESEGALL